jgi:hypothetical protein
MRPEPLRGFVLRTLLWLPAGFAAWYWSAPYHGKVAGWLCRVALDQLEPGLVTAIERSGTDLVFVTAIAIPHGVGQTALILPEVNPLLYTFGLPLFVALMLAWRARWWKVAVGAVALLPFQAWGIGFDFLAQVAIKLGPQVAAQAGMLGWKREAVALGYQVGALVFPTLIPVVLWAAFNRAFMEQALRSATRARSVRRKGRETA